MEDAKAALSAKGLLAVAEGEMPAAALCIIDVSIDDLPELPASHSKKSRRGRKRSPHLSQSTTRFVGFDLESLAREWSG